jgi:hypothetical protein
MVMTSRLFSTALADAENYPHAAGMLRIHCHFFGDF